MHQGMVTEQMRKPTRWSVDRHPRGSVARRSLALTLVALAALAWAPSAHADGAFRTVLVIDASSSMKRTDPDQLRKVAAELFVDLARNGDHIAVTGFDENARQSTGGFTTIEGPASRVQLKQAIEAIGNDGKWTDFTAGLSEARRLLAASPRKPGDQDLIVFLTDGRCEPDPKGALAEKAKSRSARTELCKEMVLGDIVSTLGGARVYAIGLSKNAPKDFLEELGRRTGGQGQVTEDPRSLPSLFAGVYAGLLGSRLQEVDMAKQASFEVYDGAQSLGLVIVGRTKRTGTLRDPAGAEIAIDNREPDKVYFVAAKEYRFYMIRAPKPGTWTFEAMEEGKHRLATLQHFDLQLSFVEPAEAVEKGKSVQLRARLASSTGAMPPMDFLDRHAMVAVAAEESGDRTIPMTRGESGIFTGEYAPEALGKLGFRLTLTPKAGGVLSRKTDVLHQLQVIPPVYLSAAPVAVGAIKHREQATAKLSLAGSKIGVPLELSLVLRKDGGEVPKGIAMIPDRVTLMPDGRDAFDLTVTVADRTAGGTHELALAITPMAPIGFADRAVTAPLSVKVIPLSFWERYGTWITRIAGGLLVLFVLIGIFSPARFKKRAILYYADIRDPELVRRSSYPLGNKAKRGFYKAASVALGPSGPVKKGGAVTLRAVAGGRIQGIPGTKGAVVYRVDLPAPEDDDESALISDLEDDERPRVSQSKGAFSIGANVGYEIKGSGFVFWYK